jgi:hypothetical protein
VEAEAACEQAVSNHILEDIVLTDADHGEASRYEFGPSVDVSHGMVDNGGCSCGAGGGVEPHDLIERGAHHAERIGIAKVLLGGERQLPDIA